MKYTIFPENSNLNKVGIVKFGIDCTSTFGIHIGHMLSLKILKEMRDKGNKIHIILGTFTSEISDPTGRDSSRPALSKEKINESADIILSQIKRILGDDIVVHYNIEWFDKMTLPEIMSILSNFTIQKLLSRESFQNRIKNGSTISVPEILYPIIQGLDSVKLNSSYEVGGTEQLLNLIAGRELQEMHEQEPQICIMCPVLTGTDGRKMSKSYDNCIYINDTPSDVFGKAMSISDATMFEWYPLFFDIFDTTRHPMELKKELAEKITDEVWGIGNGSIERKNFENRFVKGLIPDDIAEIPKDGMVNFISVLNNCSKSDARRLLGANAVSVNDVKISDVNHMLSVNDIVRVGKRGIAKVV